VTAPDFPPCTRCGRVLRWSPVTWPEGPICATCRTWALETYGTCACCGTERMVPGITADGEGRLCTDCVGIPGCYICTRCGQEGWIQRKGTCSRCVLTERLDDLLDDGTGRIRPELVPLYDGLRQATRPRTLFTWTGRDHVQRLLRLLARGQSPLTHEGLNRLTPPRSVAYLRDLLMHYGVLPHRDRHLVLFELWLEQWLATINDQGHRELLERFASWDILRTLRAAADRTGVGTSRDRNARRMLRKAEEFLTWIDDRGTNLPSCTQPDLDAWHAEAFLARRPAQNFLRWAMASHLMPRLTIPHRNTANPAPIGHDKRIRLLRRTIEDEELDLLDRVVVVLALLFAQPFSRICRLTLDDLVEEDGRLSIRFGDPPAPVPEPFAGLLRTFAARRPNLTTATNPGTRWLFPGRRAGQPMDTSTLAHRMRKNGLPTFHGRTAAIRQLVLQAPAPVIARMLGYHPEHITALAAEAGSPWSHYAPDDHAE
jgi:integrase